MRQAALVYNPMAGRRRAAERAHRLAEIFAARDWRVEPMETVLPGGGEQPARQAAERGFDVVLALGGDGTLRECAAGVLGTETGVGFLPTGTTNVMCHTFGLPNHPFRAAAALAGGRLAPMDVGLCGGTPFLMQASVGIDAAVIAALNPTTKRWLGQGAAVTAAVRVLFGYRFPRFEIVIDGKPREVSFAAICNIPFYGGPWKMTAAELDDGRLHAALFAGRGRPSTLKFAFDFLRGKHGLRNDVEIVPVEEVELPATPGAELQMDGDAFPGGLPARVRMAKHKLRVLLPPPP